MKTSCSACLGTLASFTLLACGANNTGITLATSTGGGSATGTSSGTTSGAGTTTGAPCSNYHHLSNASGGTGGTPDATWSKINHFVVIYEENHSFDNLFGEFGNGSDDLDAGMANYAPQIDATGKPYKYLPQPLDTSKSPPVPDSAFPATLPNLPFNIDQYAAFNSVIIPDLVHRFYQEQQQINGGTMNQFAQISNAAGLSMGYYHTAELYVAAEAAKYTLCDHFFHAAFGGSFLNHQWLIAAQSPTFPNAPASIVACPTATPAIDGQVTPDGFVVNTSYTVNTPHPSYAAKNTLVPNQTNLTIGDLLTQAGVSWAWYSGGWNDALAGNPDPLFQFHHQPFAFYANYADGTAAKAEHLKDEADLITAIGAGSLPAVTFYKPLGEDNEHPGYAQLATGDAHLEALLKAIRSGPNWLNNDTAIIITYDENGGQWDHVAPPTIDDWGPGTRVPAVIISPYARQGYVDSTVYDTTSILATIEHRWGLPALSSHDKSIADLRNSFDFTQAP